MSAEHALTPEALRLRVADARRMVVERIHDFVSPEVLARAEPILAAAIRRAGDPSVEPFDALLWCVGVLSVELRRVRDEAQRAAERLGVPPFRVLVEAPAAHPSPFDAADVARVDAQIRRAVLGLEPFEAAPAGSIERERVLHPILRGTATGPSTRQPAGTWRVDLKIDPPHGPTTADAVELIKAHRDAVVRQRGAEYTSDEYVAGINDCLRILIPLAARAANCSAHPTTRTQETTDG